MVGPEFLIPSTIEEALTILNQKNCYIFAGGTDLMVLKHKRSGLLPHFDKDVLFINNLDCLNYIYKDNNNSIHIGATTKYSSILNSELIPQIIKDIVIEIASPNIRNMATLAGNIANASPAGDSLVGLYALDAKVELVSLKERKIVNVTDFIIGVRKTILKKDEMIKEIIIPSFSFDKIYYKKVGSRAAESISKLSFLGAYKTFEGKLIDIRFAFGSVAPTVVRKIDIEKNLTGLKIEEIKSKTNQIADEYSKFICPITDQRSTKEYRYKVIMNLLRKFIMDMK